MNYHRRETVTVNVGGVLLGSQVEEKETVEETTTTRPAQMGDGTLTTLPETEDAYVHRVGRTARWDKTGKSYFLLGPEETMPEFVEGEVVNYPLSKDERPVPVPPMSTLYIGKGKKDKISKGDIVGFLCKKAEIGSGDIGRIDVNDRYTYVAVSRAKVRHVLRLVQGEKIKGVRTVIEPVK